MIRYPKIIVLGAVLLVVGTYFATSKLKQCDLKDPLKESFRRPENIPYPSHNSYSEEKYALGKTLFFDPRLSKSGVMSCATCHNPSFSWTDGMNKGVGHGHRGLSRKAPSLLNVAWGWSYFWDGRANTLEEQALGPIQNEHEMNMKLPELVDRIKTIKEYQPLFDRAFPNEPVSQDQIARAIATFERTIVSEISPFDSWIAGDDGAINESAKRGFALFNDGAGCVKCHNGWNFTNGQFADIGLPTEDLGRGGIVKKAAVNFAFKTPTLRNISRRAPYMHDGSFPTLRDVIDHYDKGGKVQRVTTQFFLKPLNLTEQQKRDLIAFLETLTSDDEEMTMPRLPRGEWGERTWERISSAH